MCTGRASILRWTRIGRSPTSRRISLCYWADKRLIHRVRCGSINCPHPGPGIGTEPRRVDKPVAAHAHGLEGIRRAAEAGVSSIEHCSFVTETNERCFDESLAAQIAEQGIIGEWAGVKLPPVPELKPVTVDPKTTALLVLDMMKGNCGARPRCLATIPNVRKLLAAARAHDMMVVYNLTGAGKVEDMVDSSLAPRPGEFMVKGSGGVEQIDNGVQFLLLSTLHKLLSAIREVG